MWDRNWGYLMEERIAPVLIGEWGSRLATSTDLSWAHQLRDYLAATGTPWLWWALNPNSADTGGLLADDWITVRPAVESLLGPALAATRPAIPFADAAARFSSAQFTVALDAPAGEDVVVKYATADGTASAGLDYVATAGSLTFAPGEQTKTVDVPLLPDGVREGDEFFYLVLDGGEGLRTSGTAVITDGTRDRRGAAVPFVDVAVARSAGSADGGVPREPDDAAMSGVPTGEASPAGRFTLALAAADGAAIRSAAGASAEAPATSAGLGPTAETQRTIDRIAEGTWGSGAGDSVLGPALSEASAGPAGVPSALAAFWEAELVSDTTAPDGGGAGAAFEALAAAVGDAVLGALRAAAGDFDLAPQ